MRHNPPCHGSFPKELEESLGTGVDVELLVKVPHVVADGVIADV